VVKRKMRCYHFVALLLIGTTLIVFWPVCGHKFVLWDDQINVYENPFLAPATPSNISHLWKKPYENLYIPLTYTLWAGVAYLPQRPEMEKTKPLIATEDCGMLV